jgi:hypothetical protein
VLATAHKLPLCTPSRTLHTYPVQPVGRSRPLTFDLRNENINTRTLDCRPLVGKPYPLVLLDFRRGAFCVYLVRQTWFPLATYYCIHSRVFRGIPWIYSGRPYPSTPQSQKWLSPTRREMNIASNKWVHLTRRKRRDGDP